MVKVQHKIYLRQTEEVAGTKESKGSNSVEEEYQDLILKDKALRDRSRPVPSFYQGENHYYKMLLKQAEEVRFPGKKVHTTGRRMPRY
ncbi:MAG: hypothetical protein GX767_04310 [Firmicutes bacterium]|nr:hypothetical protein [Bacillota bacterium]